MNRRIDTGVAVLWTVSAAAGKASIRRGRVDCAKFHAALPSLLGGLLAVLGFSIMVAGMMDLFPTPIPPRAVGEHAIRTESVGPTGTGWDAPPLRETSNVCVDRMLPDSPCQGSTSGSRLPLTIAAPHTTIGPNSNEARTLASLATPPPPAPHAVIFPAMARAHFASPEMRESAGPTASSPSDLRTDLAAMAESQRPMWLRLGHRELADCDAALVCSGPSAPWRPEQQSGVAASPFAEAVSSERRR
jgi:hypothetical protein